MVIPVLLFTLGFVLLIKGGDWFVDAAQNIAHRFHMPELLIGATVVSIGTTLPEVMVSCQGAMAGSGSIAFGNAIGSIICNTSLISAITLIVAPAAVNRKTFVLPSAAFFIAAAFFSVIAYAFGSFSRITGLIFLCIFVIYMVVTVIQMKKNPDAPDPAEPAEESAAEQDASDSDKEEKPTSVARDIIMLIVGAAVIAIGARLLVDNAQLLATAAGVPESVIALTLVALGTSLPELVTAITSLIKGCGALSLGNIIGANLFNLVLVLGASVTINPFDLSSASATSMSVDIPLMLAVMLVMVVPALIKQKLYRWQGILLLASYIGYCGFLFVSA